MEQLRVTISVSVLPNDYTCDGEDRSPILGVGGVNTAISKTLAILVTDQDSPGGGVSCTGLPGTWNLSGSSRRRSPKLLS